MIIAVERVVGETTWIAAWAFVALILPCGALTAVIAVAATSVRAAAVCRPPTPKRAAATRVLVTIARRAVADVKAKTVATKITLAPIPGVGVMAA